MISIIGNHAPDLIIFVSYIMVLYKMKSRIQPVALASAKKTEPKSTVKENLVVIAVEPSNDEKTSDKVNGISRELKHIYI